MKLSDNFRLIEVLPDVPPVVPLDLCLGVQLEVLTSSDPTWVNQPILGPSEGRALKSQEKSLCVVCRWVGANQKYGKAQVNIWPSWPGPDLDLSSTIFIQSCSLSLICFVEVDSWSCLWCDSGVRGGVRSEVSGSRNSVTLPSPDSEHQGTLRCHHQANIKHQESVIRSIKSHLLKKSYLKICMSHRLLRQSKLHATYLCNYSFEFSLSLSLTFLINNFDRILKQILRHNCLLKICSAGIWSKLIKFIMYKLSKDSSVVLWHTKIWTNVKFQQDLSFNVQFPTNTAKVHIIFQTK